MMMSPLLDNEFIEELNEYPQREVYAKIISLDLKENQIEEITGHVTQGSISIDGVSAVRRTCSISMVAEELNINDYYWGLNTKCEIFVGLRNFINPEYPDIIWFPQGIYVITSFSTSQNVRGYTVNLQGKDKMCLLNGDIGGTITELSVDFGTLNIIDDYGNIEHRDYLLKDIIMEAVHTYAREPYSNIIINDLDDVGLELLEYRGVNDLFLMVNQQTNEVAQMLFDKSQGGFYEYNESTDTYEESKATIGTLEENEYDTRLEAGSFGETQVKPRVLYHKVEEEYIPYTICKVTAGETIGYRVTDLIYAGKLIGAVGQSVTTAVLDPIAKQLGDFEYFYNLDGQFVWQRKKTYVNVSWNNIVTQDADYRIVPLTKFTYRPNTFYIKDTYMNFVLCEDETFDFTQTYYDRVLNENYVDNAALTSSYTFSFENSNLIPSFNNNPALNAVKNDYSIWGSRKSATGVEIPIHMRYAIDKKPETYVNYLGQTFTTKNIDEIREELWTEVKNKFDKGQNVSFIKAKNPNGLPEDWWDVKDWMNYYELITGQIPQGALGQYANEGQGKAGVEKIDLLQYFSEPPKDNTDSSWDYFQRSPVYIFDVYYGPSGTTADGYLGYSGHGCGCSHAYTYFTEKENKTSFIYKPTIPLKEIEDIFGEEVREFEEKVIAGVIATDCEWREIIYQMALDNSKYGHNDDFLTTIAKNNIDNYPNGVTGYEQYYIDMQSFWRDIYNPEKGKILLNEYLEFDMSAGVPEPELLLIPEKFLSEVYPKYSVHYKTDPESNEAGKVAKQTIFNDDFAYYNNADCVFELTDFKEKLIEYYKKEYFNSNKQNLFCKVGNVYKSVAESSQYHDSIKYYTQGRDLAEDHIANYFYQIKPDNSGYYQLAEKDVISLAQASTKNRYYYYANGQFNLYQNYNLNEQQKKRIRLSDDLQMINKDSSFYIDNYYTKITSNILMSMNIDEKYYRMEQTGKYSEINFTKLPVYDIVTEQVPIEGITYYTFNSSRGEYKEVGKLTEFTKGTSYFRLNNYPLVPSGTTAVYVNRNYQPATNIKLGVEYYTRTETLNQTGENAGTYSYTFDKCFKLDADKIYYYQDNLLNQYVKATTFLKGQTYYPQNDDGSMNTKAAISIPSMNFYVYKGYERIEFDLPIEADDYCYYTDNMGNKVFIPKGKMIMGKQNHIYHNANSELAKSDFYQGKYYIYDADKDDFVEQMILKKFDPAKVFYSPVEDAIEFVEAKQYNDYENYYIQMTSATEGNVYYISWAALLDKKNKMFNSYLKEIDDNGNIVYTLINKNLAKSEEDYYIKVGENYYLPPIAVTPSNFNEVKKILPLYVKKIDESKFKPFKHMSFTPIGTEVTIKDENNKDVKVRLTKEYYATPDYDPVTSWNKVVETPELLNFWFDFLDTEGELSQYSNYAIGNRPKAINDNNIKAIYYRETPKVIFVDSNIPSEKLEDQQRAKPGYTFIRLTDSIENLFSISSRGKSTQDELNNLLYNNSYCCENISITSIPVYHLQPNTRIFMKDKNSGINGEYIVTKLSIPLAYNGTMSISATKAVERIY